MFATRTIAAAVALLAAAGCGAGTSAAGRATEVHAAASTDDEDAIHLAPIAVSSGLTSIGRVLRDAHGRTFYEVASRGRNEFCTGSCTRTWIPVLARAGMPVAGSDVDPALVGSAQRPDYSYQVTYNGRPLYYYARDRRAG